MKLKGTIKGIITAILAFSLLLSLMPQMVLKVNAESYKGIEYPYGGEISGELDVYLSLPEKVMRPYISGFEKKYPGTKVNYKCEVSDYEGFIKNCMDEGYYGDVVFMPSFVTNNLLDTYFLPLGDVENLKEKYNYVESTNRIASTVYAIPSCAYANGIIYNKDVFAKAGITELPKTFDEFIEDLRMIKERTNAIPFCTNYGAPWALFYWTAFPFIEMTGDSSYKGGDFVHEKDPFTPGGTHYEAYKLLYDIVENKLCETNIKGLGWDKSVPKLAKGEIACMVMGTCMYNEFRSKAANPNSIGFMPFPYNIDGKQYVSIYTDYAYAVSKNGKNPKAAMAFVRYMLNESGYALGENRVSIVKTDPFSEAYGNMSDYVVQFSDPFQGVNYSAYERLNSDLNLMNTEEIKKIIEVAAGIEKGTYDDLMSNWNSRWEAKRPGNTEVHTREDKALRENNKDDESNTNRTKSIFVDNDTVSLSATEKEYIEEKGNITVGYFKEKAPFQYMSETHNFMGIAAKICETITEKIGVEITYEAYDTAKELLSALASGEIDMIAGLENDAYYSDDVKFSKEYMESINVIIRNDTLDVDSLDDSKQAIITGEAVNTNTINTEQFVSYDNVAEAVRAIDKLEVSFAIMNYYSAEYYSRRDEMAHVAIVPLSKKSGICFAFAKDVDTRLISICNKCIYSIPEENIQLIITQQMDPPTKPITIKRFIESNPLQSLAIILTFVFLVIGFLAFIRYEKNKSNQKHELDSKRYEILSRLMDEYIFEFDYVTNIISFDKKFESKFGFYGQIDALDGNINNYALNNIIKKCFDVRESDNIDIEPFELTDVDGNIQWYKMIVYIVDDPSNITKRLIGKIVNVHQEMENQLRMQEKVERDPLTGLYNRDGLEKHFEITISDWAKIKNMCLGVVDFDDFKKVNDTLGHAGGDKALKLLAEKFGVLPIERSLTARYGGDEFIVCLYGMNKSQMERYLENLVENMDCDLEYQSQKHHVSISLGVVYTEEKTDMTTLFKLADKVLYDVKTLGKNNVKIEDIKNVTE